MLCSCNSILQQDMLYMVRYPFKKCCGHCFEDADMACVLLPPHRVLEELPALFARLLSQVYDPIHCHSLFQWRELLLC